MWLSTLPFSCLFASLSPVRLLAYSPTLHRSDSRNVLKTLYSGSVTAPLGWDRIQNAPLLNSTCGCNAMPLSSFWTRSLVNVAVHLDGRRPLLVWTRYGRMRRGLAGMISLLIGPAITLFGHRLVHITRLSFPLCIFCTCLFTAGLAIPSSLKLQLAPPLSADPAPLIPLLLATI